MPVLHVFIAWLRDPAVIRIASFVILTVGMAGLVAVSWHDRGRHDRRDRNCDSGDDDPPDTRQEVGCPPRSLRPATIPSTS